MALQSSSSSYSVRPFSSSFIRYEWKYHVFISFRGQDTRSGFTGNLYKALCDNGILTTFDDGELQSGEEITPALIKAIEESRIAIIVLSPNYAASSFCLDELVHVLHCIKGNNRLVLPVFYEVDPSDVRHLKNSFGEAMDKYEKRYKDDMNNKVDKWKKALHQVANLSGYHFKYRDGYEHMLIGNIVANISKRIRRCPLLVAEHPVGLDSRVSEVASLLDVESNDGVHMVGIYGIGGIGKTTLARAVYNLIADLFEGVCFLENVRENSNKYGLVHLQNIILCGILEKEGIQIVDVKQGVSEIQRRLQRKKVLLVLDDVDEKKHLTAIAGKPDWFGHGSRIIITTRDSHLLTHHGIERTYEVHGLNEEESLNLLNWKAFKTDLVNPSYANILARGVTFASGIPLALEVIGSNLFGKNLEQWESELDQHKKIVDKKILKILQKLEIIGCLELKAPLPEVGNARDVFIPESLEILKGNVAKSRSQASLRQVKALEEGHKIAQQSKSNIPNTSTTKEIEEIPPKAIMETQSMGSSRLPLHSSSSDARIPSGMLSHQFAADNPDIEQLNDPQSSMAEADIPITTQATLLPVTATPSTATPVKGETLPKVDLDDQQLSSQVLTVSSVVQLSLLPLKLRTLKIEGCEFLEKIPDDLLGGMNTLKELYLISCSSLISLSYPDSLTTLYISNCRNLKPFSSSESWKRLVSLHHLFIGSSCDPITTLPLNSFRQLKTLCIWDWLNFQSFYFTRDQRVGLPLLESIEIRDCPTLRHFPEEGLHSPKLTSILLSNCENLKILPKHLSSLKSLKSLFLHRCPQIECFPPGGLPSSLVFLSIAYCNELVPQLDWGLSSLESLSHFELEGGCMGMESFPEENLLPCNINSLHISKLKSLKKLDYRGFQHLNALQTLEIYCCKMLRRLPDQGLPSSLEHLNIQECPLLTRRLKPMTGDEWHKVADIPHIQIDDQVLS